MAQPQPPSPQLERTSSLPQLESVPSPPRAQLPTTAVPPSSAQTSNPPPLPPIAEAASSTTTSASSSAVPTLHDELPRTFSGSLLHSLEHLGVSAYSTADVEQTVIARALQVEAEAQQAKQTTASSRRPPSDSSLKRKRAIPRRVGTSIASAALPLPIPSPIVHHDDPVTAAGSMGKQRLEEALAIRSRRDRPTTRTPSTPTESGGGGRGRSVDDELPSGLTERQRMIDGGEVTPFNGMKGVEKGFQRVSRPAQLQAASVQSPRRPQREDRQDRVRERKQESPSRPKPSARSSTPTLQPPPAASSRARLSATPPPGRPRSSSASSSASASPARSPSPALEVSELPVRLTRARVKEEVRSIELAVRKRELKESGVKEEEEGVIVLDGDEAEADVRMMEEEEASALAKEDDEEWKGDDEESSEEEKADDVDDDDDLHAPHSRRPARRRQTGRRRLMKAEVDEEDTEQAEQAEARAYTDDDDGDDGEPRGEATSAQGGRILDDFFDLTYEERLEAMRHSKAFANEVRRVEGREEKEGEEAEDSLDVAFDGGYVLPGRIWDRLFGYQKTSVKWMWELHCQRAGGIIADEMGLGKTVQMVAFLAGLHYSQAIFKANTASSTSTSLAPSPFHLPPTLVLCPATIQTQWLREFHSWYPELRVLVLHESVQAHHGQSKEAVVDKLFASAHVLITTYECARLYRHLLLHREFGYVVLDEGHKIRNPDAAITLVCKQLLSIHRVILTGAPIQNNLVELWSHARITSSALRSLLSAVCSPSLPPRSCLALRSLFDFVFPGKLGTLPVFEDEFCHPINQGGYTNASATQVQLAYRCAAVLRDIISPYILRRNKADVAKHLPTKTEQVLFVNLSPAQRDVYKHFLASEDVQQTIDGRGSLFRAIHVLRKICNHPDLLLLKDAVGAMGTVTGSGRKVEPRDVPDYGAVERSGKMQVVQQILQVWHAEGHRVLLFTQTRQMLDILESFVAPLYSYHRIDGLTSIRSRLPMIDSFNSDPSIFLFLLTTKAGGLGVNLTGADRVLLYDPDWNPSTDLQARERSWRIGQRREVTVYRLIVRGTIEEKIYHRQIFKQFLTKSDRATV